MHFVQSVCTLWTVPLDITNILLPTQYPNSNSKNAFTQSYKPSTSGWLKEGRCHALINGDIDVTLLVKVVNASLST